MNISQRIIELEKGCKYKENAICGEVYPKGVFYNFEGLFLCQTCEAKIQLLKEIKEDVLREQRTEMKVLEKIDNIWAEMGVEDNNGILLDRIHSIVCKRYDELKQNLIGETKWK